MNYGNGNGNGTMMVSQEPQLGEMGLTHVVPGQSQVRTLVVETNPGGWLSLIDPLKPETRVTTANQLVVDAIRQALGELPTRTLVRLQVVVEVIDHVDETPNQSPVIATQPDPTLDAVTANFIGIGEPPAVSSPDGYDDEF